MSIAATDPLAKAAEASLRAPSVFNTQPWHWRVGPDVLELWSDPDRQLPVVDPEHRLTTLSCGIALHHARTALATEGCTDAVERLPDPARPDLLARVRITGRHSPQPADVRRYQASLIRHTDRRLFTDQPAPPEALERLCDVAEDQGAHLYVLVAEDMHALATVVFTAQRAQLNNPAYRAELARWTGRPESTGDGLTADTVTPPTRAAYESAQANTLSTLAAGVLRGEDTPPALLEQLRQTFGLRAVSLLERRPDDKAGAEWYVAASAGWHPPERPEGADVALPVADGLVIAGLGRLLSADEQRILTAYVTHIAPALTRQLEPQPAARARLAGSLAAAVPGLCAALATAQAALADLAGPAKRLTASEQTRLAAAQASVGRTARLLADLDDLCRLQAGALDCRLRPVDLAEATAAAFDDLGPDGQPITVTLPEALPYVIADSRLLSRSIASLAADALRRSPPHAPPAIAAGAEPEHLLIRVIDHSGDAGSGRTEGQPAVSTSPARTRSPGTNLAQQLALALTDAMGGTLRVERTPDGGLTVTITLPTANRRRHANETQAGRAAAPDGVHGPG